MYKVSFNHFQRHLQILYNFDMDIYKKSKYSQNNKITWMVKLKANSILI